jgi:hypothetical protein
VRFEINTVGLRKITIDWGKTRRVRDQAAEIDPDDNIRLLPSADWGRAPEGSGGSLSRPEPEMCDRLRAGPPTSKQP